MVRFPRLLEEESPQRSCLSEVRRGSQEGAEEDPHHSLVFKLGECGLAEIFLRLIHYPSLNAFAVELDRKIVVVLPSGTKLIEAVGEVLPVPELLDALDAGVHDAQAGLVSRRQAL